MRFCSTVDLAITFVIQATLKISTMMMMMMMVQS